MPTSIEDRKRLLVSRHKIILEENHRVDKGSLQEGRAELPEVGAEEGRPEQAEMGREEGSTGWLAEALQDYESVRYEEVDGEGESPQVARAARDRSEQM